MLISLVLLTSYVNAEDVFLSCSGEARIFVHDGTTIDEPSIPFPKNYLLVLQDNSVEVIGKQAEYTNKTKTYFTWWYSQPKEDSNKAGPQIISGELNRITGKVTIRETVIFDEKSSRYNEQIFNGNCEKTEQKF